MAAKKNPSRIVSIELTPRSMLCLLEHGFEPESGEKFIDRLFEQYDKMTEQERKRFRKYIEAHGTEDEKTHLSELK